MSNDFFHPILFSGDEQFIMDGKPAGFTVKDYWRFQFSNIWDNQEEVAEYIVAKALGIEFPHNKNGWTLWDITYKGKRIEIKKTGYYHSWRTDGKVSLLRTFGIGMAYTRYADPTSEFKRQNDIYIFCLNTGTTQDESNPLNLDNWRFWVVPTETINCFCGDNKKISLGRVKSITKLPNGISYSELKTVVDAAIDKQ